MIIQGVPITRLMKWADRAFFVLLALTFFSPLLLFLLTQSPSHKNSNVLKVNNDVAKVNNLDYEQIGQGALGIEEGFGGLPLPNLKKEILLISSNTASKCFLFGLKSSFEKRESRSGQKHFLCYGKDGELLFSDQPTPFSITPSFVNGKLEVEVGLSIKSEGHTVVDEEARFTANSASKEQVARFLGEGIFGEPFLVMESARLLAPDQLFILYGGEEYSREAGAARLLFQDQILYVTRGDRLFFEKGRWKPINGQTENNFLAKILKVSPQRVDAEISDSKGLLKRKIAICRKPTRISAFRAGELFTQIRPRTATTVSLKIAGASSHLKRGDWLLNEGDGWQLLESWSDVESYLSFERQGELFVFDGVEKSGTAQYFCGHYFDKMREGCETVRLPLTIKEKAVKKKVASRRPVFSPPERTKGEEDEDLDY